MILLYGFGLFSFGLNDAWYCKQKENVINQVFLSPASLLHLLSGRSQLTVTTVPFRNWVKLRGDVLFRKIYYNFCIIVDDIAWTEPEECNYWSKTVIRVLRLGISFCDSTILHMSKRDPLIGHRPLSFRSGISECLTLAVSDKQKLFLEMQRINKTQGLMHNYLFVKKLKNESK